MIAAVALALVLADQNALSVARDFYASAAYEDALAALDKAPAGASADEVRAMAQYRAFCLLALGRAADAERAIEAVVAGDPMFRPAAADASPRVRAAFADVRRRMLPAIIQQRYAAAKSAYDRKEFATASAAFGYLLDVMDDVDAAAAMSQPPLADLRMLAGGFHDLAKSAATPPPLPASPVAVVPPPPVPAVPRIYTASDAGIVPPQVIRQELPTFPGEVSVRKQGTLEVVIDEAGGVEQAMMRQSVSQTYDTLALTASRSWRYRPATIDGKPVKYRKTIVVSVKPGGDKP